MAWSPTSSTEALGSSYGSRRRCPTTTSTGPYADPELRSFTKRLVFSSWAVAPKAISSVVSYEAERRISELGRQTSSSSGFTQYDARVPRVCWTFNRSADGRNTGMPVLGLLYPSPTLAAIGDPLDIARELDAALPLPWSVLKSRRYAVGSAWHWRSSARTVERPGGRALVLGRTGQLLDRARGLDLMGDLQLRLLLRGARRPPPLRRPQPARPARSSPATWLDVPTTSKTSWC